MFCVSSWQILKGHMAERFTRLDDPRIALYRGVRDPDLARTHGLFVAEGRLVVRRVLEDTRYRVRSVLLNDAAHGDLAPVLGRHDPAVPIFLCDTDDFASITGVDIHRGCLALVERPAPSAAADLIATARSLVVLDGVANADNVGGVFRNAAAFDAGGVLLSPTCCDPLYRKAVRTSMGAVLRVPFAYVDAWPADLVQVRAQGFTLIALTPREPSETLERLAARGPGSRVALLVGAEGSGLTPAVEAAADIRVRIPVSREVDSLNLAVAVGIALYRLRDVG